MTKTYTVAYTEALIACAPDGHIEEALREFEKSVDTMDRNNLTIETGLILTDEEPEDQARIAWRGTSMGAVGDEHGQTYQFAIYPE